MTDSLFPDDADQWLIVAHSDIDLSRALDEASATDDPSYCSLRLTLPKPIRLRADKVRFDYFVNASVNIDDPEMNVVERFVGAPREVLELSVDLLGLSVRTSNRMEYAELLTIGQVVKFGSERLLGIQGLGRKSLLELGEVFAAVVAKYFEVGGFEVPKAKWSQSEPLPFGASSALQEPPFVIRKLAAAIRHWLESLADKPRIIVKARLGLGVPAQTLEQIGVALGVTRERIRQIESKTTRSNQLAQAWIAAMNDKLRNILISARSPIWLITLPYVDEFFDDFEWGESALARVVDSFSEGQSHVLTINGSRLVSSVSEEQWVRMKADALSVARSCASRRAQHVEMVVAVEAIAYSRGSIDLAPLLVELAEAYVHVAKVPGVSEPVVVAYGRGADGLVRVIVEEALEPLHYSEVHRRAMLRGAEDLDVRRVHNALGTPEYYLCARGTYGLWRHLGFRESVAARVQEMSEEVILSADRQWHVGEIVDAMRNEDPNLAADLDSYRLNAVLRRSSLVRSLGRMVWVSGESQDKQKSDRIDIAQACTKILQDAGRPLPRSEVLARLREWRGIGQHFQIHFSDEIFPVEPGVFGLRSRDLPVTMAQIHVLLDALFHELGECGKGIHTSELMGVFQRAGLSYASRVNHSSLYAFAVRDERFQVDSAGYVGLAKWEGTRRLSLGAAGRRLAQMQVSPVSVDEFLERIAALLGRSLTRLDATMALRDSGYIYVPSQRHWVLPADDQSESD